MKTTKVLGIVLGALLVAGLFAGAAAAADSDVYLGDAYAWVAYSSLGGTPIQGNTTWNDAFGNTVTFLAENTSQYYYISGDDVAAEGDYFCEFGGKKYHITVKFPTAAIAGSVYKWDKDSGVGDLVSALIGSTVENDKFVNFTSSLATDNIALTNPAGTFTAYNLSNHGAEFNSTNTAGWTIKGLDLGKWTAQAMFAKDTYYPELGGNVSKYAPNYIYGKPYYFTIVSSDDSKKLEEVTDGIVQGGYATVALTAPVGEWMIHVDNGGKLPNGQPYVSDNVGIPTYNSTNGYWNITVGSSGVSTFVVTTEGTSNIKVELLDQADANKVLKSVTIKVTSGSITATAADASVFIGNDFDVDGTNDLGGTLYFFIKGTNYDFKPVAGDGTKYLTATGKEWTATVKTSALVGKDNKKPDAGTYTIYVASLKNTTDAFIDSLKKDNMDDETYVKAYATISVALKQPFISITKAPEVLVQGEKLVIEGTAEGDPSEVQYYIFGTNYFNFGKESVTDGVFSVEVSKTYTDKDYMAAGQYFFVVQHKMYDGKFNIGANFTSLDGKTFYNASNSTKGDIVLNKNNDVYDYGSVANTVLFSTIVRQSANAAQALCDALDSQDIDDMYAKASFIVAGPTSYIDPVPSQITKGQVLTISGTTTGHKDDVVTVELISTAFAAVPKETVGSASFVALTTKIGADGVWSISFDTSNLNADEYTCSVAVADLDATTSKITIVEGAGPQPTQTAGPVTPTAQPTAQPTQTPATPGFGALAALAGLGAVAVLLLRRQ